MSWGEAGEEGQDEVEDDDSDEVEDTEDTLLRWGATGSGRFSELRRYATAAVSVAYGVEYVTSTSDRSASSSSVRLRRRGSGRGRLSLDDTDMARRGLGSGRPPGDSAVWLTALGRGALRVLARARGSSYRGFLQTCHNF